MNVSRHAKALASQIADSLPSLKVTDIQENDWQSSTFTGMQLHMTFIIKGKDVVHEAERLHRELPEREFALHRYFVADIEVAGIETMPDRSRICVTALLLEQ